MAVTLLIPENESYFKDRINKLTPESERQFGQLDVVGMMRHMRNAVETSIGETDLPDESNFLSPLLLFAITRVLTKWPGGRIKAPDYWTPVADTEFEEEKELLLGALDRYFAKYQSEPEFSAPHPMLGTLSKEKWARLNGIHFTHHFRQFSVN